MLATIILSAFSVAAMSADAPSSSQGSAPQTAESAQIVPTATSAVDIKAPITSSRADPAVFERRAYMLKPGYEERFWKAQEQWNGSEIFAPILGHNMFYASHASSKGTLIVHLYGFSDLLEWQNRYADYYGRQNPEYFATVRPWMLHQENGFFRAAGDAVLGGFPRIESRQAAEAGERASEGLVILETTIDLAPGGLQAFTALGKQAGPAMIGVDPAYHLGTLISLIGKQHRVLHYHVFPSRSAAKSTALAIGKSLQRYRETHGKLSYQHLWLTPSPLASRRTLLSTLPAAHSPR